MLNISQSVYNICSNMPVQCWRSKMWLGWVCWLFYYKMTVIFSLQRVRVFLFSFFLSLSLSRSICINLFTIMEMSNWRERKKTLEMQNHIILANCKLHQSVNLCEYSKVRHHSLIQVESTQLAFNSSSTSSLFLIVPLTQDLIHSTASTFFSNEIHFWKNRAL